MNFNEKVLSPWKCIYELIRGGYNEESMKLKMFVDQNMSKEEIKSEDSEEDEYA